MNKEVTYNNLTEEELIAFLNEIVESKVSKDKGNPFVEQVSENLFKIGDAYFNGEGLKEFDKAMIKKAKEYGK